MMRTKVVVTLGLALALVLVGTRVGTLSAYAAPLGGKVTICHFEGHNGPTGSDLVTSNFPALNSDCVVKLGGTLITVGQQACENGHKATPWPDNRPHACALGNVDD